MKPELKYGLIAGAGVCLWILTEFLLGFHTTHVEVGEYTGYFSGLIPLTTLYLLLKNRRDTSPGGQLSVGAGQKSGLSASCTAALVISCFLLVYNQFINPGCVDLMLDRKVAQMRAAGLAEVDIRAQIKFLRQLSSPLGQVITTILMSLVMGAISSAGLTLLLRRRPRW